MRAEGWLQQQWRVETQWMAGADASAQAANSAKNASRSQEAPVAPAWAKFAATERRLRVLAAMTLVVSVAWTWTMVEQDAAL